MKVAVVILNWNGKGFLEKFLPSLFNSLPSYAELIVADNASTDGSKEAVHNEKIQWIQLDKNYGFTGGYNRAFEKLDGYKYYVLINSDIEITERWLETLTDFMEKHPEASACQPKILSYANKDHFEYAGAAGGFIDRWGFPLCRGRILSCIEEDKGQYDSPIQCFWASGACMVVRSDVWRRLGGLDEEFFAHMEEIDFCWRASLAGGQIWCVPQSKVYHVGGGTLPNNSPRKLYFNYRNNLLMLWKNLPAKHKNGKIFLRKCIDGLSAVCYIFQGRFSYFKSVIKAHRDYRKLKAKVTVTPNEKGALPYGMLPYSIIRKFFTGHRKYSQL
ncbi:MAG: glycosyltransferase family 2 protein [Bacteroidales bacterium]|nr:glycosyltransferase family 2 protein [Bacteroidales bacterium]